MTSKPTIVDMLYMPEAANIDIEFETLSALRAKLNDKDELAEEDETQKNIPPSS